MIKNDIYEITIDDIGNDGEGIGHVLDRQNGKSFAVFVKDTVIGDRARIRIVKAKKTYAYGRLEALIEPSPYRTEAVCSRARSCGGCSLMHMAYEKQLAYKWNKVKSCLERIGGISDAATIMEPVCGMEAPYFYRNKMQLPVGRDRDGNIVIGFYAGRTHSIINLEKCYIGHEVNDYIIKHMRKWLENTDARNDILHTEDIIYNEEKHTGLVRHILTRVGFAIGELMVCLVINGDTMPNEYAKSFVDAVSVAVEEYNSAREKKENIKNNGTGNMNAGGNAVTDKLRKVKLTSVCVNVNKEKTNKILGDKCITLYGKDYIEDYIGDILFRISPLSFYQVNPVQTKAIYDKAIEYAELNGSETVWDMYCGIGTISLSLAKKAKKVYGVEIVPAAICDAKENARINNINNVEFFCGKAEEVVPRVYEQSHMTDNNAVDDKAKDGNAVKTDNRAHPDVVVVDPPRKGCDAVLLDTIVSMSPDRLVYVSCDPATLARDVKILSGKGYKLMKVAVFDAFCQSGHVESVALMSRVDTPK